MKILFLAFTPLWLDYMRNTVYQEFCVGNGWRKTKYKAEYRGFPADVEIEFVYCKYEGDVVLKLLGRKCDKIYVQSDVMLTSERWRNIDAELKFRCKEYCYVSEWEEVREDAVKWNRGMWYGKE